MSKCYLLLREWEQRVPRRQSPQIRYCHPELASVSWKLPPHAPPSTPSLPEREADSPPRCPGRQRPGGQGRGRRGRLPSLAAGSTASRSFPGGRGPALPPRHADGRGGGVGVSPSAPALPQSPPGPAHGSQGTTMASSHGDRAAPGITGRDAPCAAPPRGAGALSPRVTPAARPRPRRARVPARDRPAPLPAPRALLGAAR